MFFLCLNGLVITSLWNQTLFAACTSWRIIYFRNMFIKKLWTLIFLTSERWCLRPIAEAFVTPVRMLVGQKARKNLRIVLTVFIWSWAQILEFITRWLWTYNNKHAVTFSITISFTLIIIKIISYLGTINFFFKSCCKELWFFFLVMFWDEFCLLAVRNYIHLHNHLPLLHLFSRE